MKTFGIALLALALFALPAPACPLVGAVGAPLYLPQAAYGYSAYGVAPAPLLLPVPLGFSAYAAPAVGFSTFSAYGAAPVAPLGVGAYGGFGGAAFVDPLFVGRARFRTFGAFGARGGFRTFGRLRR